LPPCPKFFHGRETELQDVVNILLQDSAHIAILGTGGMGKTSLATTALHNQEVEAKYSHRYFVPCHLSPTCTELVATIDDHIGLEKGSNIKSNQLSKAIVKHLGTCGPCLIVLDNFETPWEALEFRGRVEEFISLLADIPTLGLMARLHFSFSQRAEITMRGAERPSKMKWSRPFLAPLEPLSPSAARQNFSEVTDHPNGEEEEALATLVDLSGNLPLAVSLMANITSFEGYTGTLALLEAENTALLLDGRNSDAQGLA
ncbi:P-loop containing nucleoside triphosphate hydrolase protein, partial [Mycena rebaudengoi]